MRFLIIFILISVLTACVTDNKKTYTKKIKFHQNESQKVLYTEPKAEGIPEEYYKTNFSDTEIAENKLKIHMLHRLNEYNKSFIPIAQKEIKTVQKFTAALKARISEMDNQLKQLEELQKQIKESKQKITQLKLGEKNELTRY